MRTIVVVAVLAFSFAARAVDVPVPVNVPAAPSATAGSHTAADPSVKKRTHAAAVVGITAASANLVGYSALMGVAFLSAGYLSTSALLIPIAGMPIVVGIATYIAGTFVTDGPGALADTGGALLGHYLGLFLGLVSGIGAGLTYQAVNQGSTKGGDFNVNTLSFGGSGALVGAALGGTVGSAVGGGLVAALTVDTE